MVSIGETSTTLDSSLFSKEQLELLQKIFGQSQSIQPTVIASGSVVHKGNFISVLNTKREQSYMWIVDSRVSDHMIGDIKQLTKFNPCYENWIVRITDGSLSRAVGTGSIVLSKDLTLNCVLLVPNLDCNLLSVSKITRDLNCVAKICVNFRTWIRGR